jgi:hypothetical protein
MILFTTDDDIEVTDDNSSWEKFHFFIPQVDYSVSCFMYETVIKELKKYDGVKKYPIFVNYNAAKQYAKYQRPIISMRDLKGCTSVADIIEIAISKLSKV